MRSSLIAAAVVVHGVLLGAPALAQDPPADPPAAPPAPPAPPPAAPPAAPPPGPGAAPIAAQPVPPMPPQPPSPNPPPPAPAPEPPAPPPQKEPPQPREPTPPRDAPPAPAVDPGRPPTAPLAPPNDAPRPDNVAQEENPKKDKDKDEVKDGVRARGGFGVSGGVMFLPNTSAGPAFGFNARIGVQINHYIGIVYQNTPIVTFTPQQSGSGLTQSAGFKAGFADYNTFLFMLTLGHFFDIGAGPSIDFLAVANGNASISGQSIESSSGVSPGAHGRVAFNIGGVSGNGPRRSGFNIGVDAHPMFTSAGTALSLTLGLGGEWY